MITPEPVTVVCRNTFVLSRPFTIPPFPLRTFNLHSTEIKEKNMMGLLYIFVELWPLMGPLSITQMIQNKYVAAVK
jgi:hypothetical protein